MLSSMDTTTKFSHFFVTYVDKEGPFLKLWGQPDRDNAVKLSQLLQTTQQSQLIRHQVVEALKPGTIHCACNNDGSLHRIRVQSLEHLNRGYIEVMFIDVGYRHVISVVNIMPLSAELRSINAQARSVLLAEAFAVDGEWNEQTLALAADQLLHRDVTVSLIQTVGRHALARVFYNNSPVPIELTSMLHAKGLMRLTNINTQEAVLLAQMLPAPKSATAAIQLTASTTPPLASPTMPLPANPPSATGVLKFNPYQLKVGLSYMVYVSYLAEGPCNFSVQLQEYEQELSSLMKDINNLTLVPWEGIPFVGNPCLACCVDDSTICRAVVYNVSGDHYVVYYVDFGYTGTVAPDGLYQIPSKYMLPQAYAIEFQLAGIEKSQLTIEMQCRFKQFVDNKAVCMKVLSVKAPLVCELFDPQTNESARDMLLRSAARSLSYAAPPTLHRHQRAIVRVTSVDSCSHFFVRIKSDEPTFNTMMQRIQKIGKTPNMPKPASFDLGTVCIALDDVEQQWFRAKIINIDTASKTFIVLFVDVGKRELMTTARAGSHIKAIDRELVEMLPPQAVECSLYGYQNVEPDLDRDRVFSDIVLKAELRLEVMDVVNVNSAGEDGRESATTTLVQMFDSSNYNVSSLLLNIVATGISEAGSPVLLQAGNKIEQRKSIHEPQRSSEKWQHDSPEEEWSNNKKRLDRGEYRKKLSTSSKDSEDTPSGGDASSSPASWNRNTNRSDGSTQINRNDTWRGDNYQRNTQQSDERFQRRDYETKRFSGGGGDSWQSNVKRNEKKFESNDTQANGDKHSEQNATSDSWSNNKTSFNSRKPDTRRNYNNNERTFESKPHWKQHDDRFSGHDERSHNVGGKSGAESDQWSTDNDGNTSLEVADDRKDRGWREPKDERQPNTKFNNRYHKDSGTRDGSNRWNNDNAKGDNRWNSERPRTNNQWNNDSADINEQSGNNSKWSRDNDKPTNTKLYNRYNRDGGTEENVECGKDRQSRDCGDFGSNRRQFTGDFSNKQQSYTKRRDDYNSNNSEGSTWNNNETTNNTHSAADESEPEWANKFDQYKSMCETCIDPYIPTKKSVSLTWFRNPCTFFVQLQDKQNDLITLMQEIQVAYKRRKPNQQTFDSNHAVIARYSEDNVLYRARVIGSPSGGEYQVFFVDYGNKGAVTDLWPIEQRFLALEAQALCCCLDGIAGPPATSETWPSSQQYSTYFNCPQFTGEFLSKLPSPDDDKELDDTPIYLVNLLDEAEVSIGQRIVDDGMATAVSTESTPTVTVEAAILFGQQFKVMLGEVRSMDDMDLILECGATVKGAIHRSSDTVATDLHRATLEERINTIVVVYVNDILENEKLSVTLYNNEDGIQLDVLPRCEVDVERQAVERICPPLVLRSTIEGYVTHANSDLIYVQESSNGEAIAYQEQRMCEIYTGENAPITPPCPIIGTVYAVCSSDENWYRGRVLSIDNDTSAVTVMFIDYGNTETLSWDRIRDLVEECLYYPQLAIPVNMPPIDDSTTLPHVDQFVKLMLTWNKSGWSGTLISEATEQQLVQETLQADCTNTIEVKPDTALLPPHAIPVVVSHVDSPNDFYIQLVDSLGALEQLQEQLQQLVTRQEYPESDSQTVMSELITANVGVLCAAPFSIDQQWYRAQVLDFDPDITTVRFVDYGNTDVIDNHKIKLKTLPEHMLSLELYASRCSLDLDEDDEQMCLKFQDILNKVDDKTLISVQFTNQDEKINYVDLFVNGVSVKSMLLPSSGHADSIRTAQQDNTLDSINTSISTPLTQSESVPSMLQIAFVSHYNSIHEFWIQLETCIDELKWIEHRLACSYPDDGAEQTTSKNLQPGLLCAAQYAEDRLWYRARILSVNNDSDIVNVLFIDYGNSSLVQRNQLRQLDEELLMMAALAQKCTLARVGTSESAATWSAIASDRLRRLAADGQTRFAMRKLTDGETTQVQLFLVNDDECNVGGGDAPGADVYDLVSAPTQTIAVQKIVDEQAGLDGGFLLVGQEDNEPYFFHTDGIWKPDAAQLFIEMINNGQTIFHADIKEDRSVILYLNDENICSHLQQTEVYSTDHQQEETNYDAELAGPAADDVNTVEEILNTSNSIPYESETSKTDDKSETSNGISDDTIPDEEPLTNNNSTALQMESDIVVIAEQFTNNFNIQHPGNEYYIIEYRGVSNNANDKDELEHSACEAHSGVMENTNIANEEIANENNVNTDRLVSDDINSISDNHIKVIADTITLPDVIGNDNLIGDALKIASVSDSTVDCTEMNGGTNAEVNYIIDDIITDASNKLREHDEEKFKSDENHSEKPNIETIIRGELEFTLNCALNSNDTSTM